MSSIDQFDHHEGQLDPAYIERLKALADARAAAAAARTAARTAARVNAAASPDSIKAENAIRRKDIHQQIDAIVCPDCKRHAKMLENPTYKCDKCKGGVTQGGSKRKSKSHRRKKSKSQRRKKSIKRRH